MALLIVTNLNNSGAGSLRDAVTQANATADFDTITFSTGLSGTIDLSSGLVLSNNVRINGDTNEDGDSDITLTNGGSTALMIVNSGVYARVVSVNFSGATQATGASALQNNGSLALYETVFSNNVVTGGITSTSGAGQSGATVINAAGAILDVFYAVFVNNSARGQQGYSGLGAGMGGHASASILNSGIVQFRDRSFGVAAVIGGTATGGNGGYDPFSGFGQDGGHAAVGVLNLPSGRTQLFISNQNPGTATGGTGASGQTSGADGTASVTNLNVGGTAQFNQEAMGTHLADNLTVPVVPNVIGGGILGLGGPDILTGGDFVTLSGGAGNDILVARAGGAAIGGPGNDIMRPTYLGGSTTYFGRPAGGLWDGDIGIDTFDASGATGIFGNLPGMMLNLSNNSNNFSGSLEEIENIIGTDNAAWRDSLIGDSGVNNIQGLAGNDFIEGKGGADVLNGGTNTAAGDTLRYESSTAGISINLLTSLAQGGDAQGDTIAGFENVIGTSFGDQRVGDNGANALSGGAGNDLLVGGLGPDTMIGGADLDVVDYSSFGSGVSVNLTTGTGPGGDVISEIENITGSAFGDVLDGNNGANTMRGGAGNDFMVAGNGADLLIGGADNDEVSYATATTGVLVNLSTGTGANGGVLQEIENIRGSNFGDVLQGDNGANTIRGLDGNDFIIAGNGADLLIGGNDNDTVSYETATSGIFANLTTGIGANGGVLQEIENLTGSNFGDVLIGSALGNTLKGGASNDFIVGNSGSDALYGGADNDTFRFETTTFGNDVIVDFQDNGDKLSFAAAVATNFSQFTILNNNTTNVTVQIAGQSIVVQGVANISLTAGDFLFI